MSFNYFHQCNNLKAYIGNQMNDLDFKEMKGVLLGTLINRGALSLHFDLGFNVV